MIHTIEAVLNVSKTGRTWASHITVGFLVNPMTPKTTRSFITVFELDARWLAALIRACQDVAKNIPLAHISYLEDVATLKRYGSFGESAHMRVNTMGLTIPLPSTKMAREHAITQITNAVRASFQDLGLVVVK